MCWFDVQLAYWRTFLHIIHFCFNVSQFRMSFFLFIFPDDTRQLLGTLKSTRAWTFHQWMAVGNVKCPTVARDYEQYAQWLLFLLFVISFNIRQFRPSIVDWGLIAAMSLAMFLLFSVKSIGRSHFSLHALHIPHYAHCLRWQKFGLMNINIMASNKDASPVQNIVFEKWLPASKSHLWRGSLAMPNSCMETHKYV